MSELVLTAFVYLSMIMLTVTLFGVGIVVLQLIEDSPAIRTKIWNLKTRGSSKD